MNGNLFNFFTPVTLIDLWSTRPNINMGISSCRPIILWNLKSMWYIDSHILSGKLFYILTHVCDLDLSLLTPKTIEVFYACRPINMWKIKYLWKTVWRRTYSVTDGQGNNNRYPPSWRLYWSAPTQLFVSSSTLFKNYYLKPLQLYLIIPLSINKNRLVKSKQTSNALSTLFDTCPLLSYDLSKKCTT